MHEHTAADFLPLSNLSFHLLLALGSGESHGYALGKEIEERSEGRLRPTTGSLYQALKRLTEVGYDIVIISNQAGVNKGFFTIADLRSINDRVLERINASGGKIRSVHYCPHRNDERCGCRKPRTGLFREATKGQKVDFGKTFFIGDGATDIEAGSKVGCRTILVLSGKSSAADIDGWKYKPEHIKKDLLEAVDWILSNGDADA